MSTIQNGRTVNVLHPITRMIVGGAQENTMYTAALLDETRFRAEVLCGPQTGSEGSLIDETRARGVRLTINPHLVRQIAPLEDVLSLRWLVRFMRQRDITIVHTHSSKAGILGRLAAKMADVPIIVHTVHGWSFHEFMSPIIRKVYILMERWVGSFTDALVVVAKSDIKKGLLAGIGNPCQYHLIHSAIPLDEFNPESLDPIAIRKELGIPNESLVIGNVGRFSKQKNPLDWIRVAGKVNRINPNTLFLLVGDGPLRTQVEALLEAEGIRDRTILTGLRRDVPRMLSTMDIFLLTSLWEGLPRVIPQAMAMGIPVITNRAGGTSEVIQDGKTGYVCSPGNLDEMVQRCSDLIQFPQMRKKMGLNGIKVAQEQFDLRQMITQVECLYNNLLT